MNPYKAVLLAITSALALGGCSAQQCNAPEPAVPEVSVASSVEEGKDRVERSNTVTITAVVEAIDHQKRLVTLRGPDGVTTTIEAGPEVKNLAQVNKGDQVNVEYYESLAFQLRQPGTAKVGDAAMVEGAEAAQLGQKPGGVGARAMTVVTMVEAVDKKMGTLTLKGPEGKSKTIKAQNPANLDKVKVGDLLEVTYTEAVAISVEKP